MELWLIKDREGKFHPLNESDREKADKIPALEETLFTYKKIRNGKFHRKYFAMLNMAYDNQDQYKNFDHFRKIIQMKAGYYDTVVTDKGEVYLPLSIAFDKMDNNEFEKLYEAAWKVLYELFAFDRELFENELNAFA